MSRAGILQLFLFCIGSIVVESCVGQTASPSTTPAKAPSSVTHYAGCVQRSTTDKDTITLSSETVCAKLTGTFVADKLVGHEVDLKGVLTDGTASTPAVIRVGSISSIGKNCSDVFSLLPPGKRGLKKGELPGKEGGTPGAAPTKPPQ